MASGANVRPTALHALVYAFYGLGALVVLVAVLWLFGVVPGWVVPGVLALTVIVFVFLWRALDRFRQTGATTAEDADGSENRTS